MRGKHDPNPALFGLMVLILILGLANHNDKPSQRSQWLFFITITSICTYLLFFCASSDLASDYLFMHFVTTHFFTSLDYILLRKYQPEFRPLGQKPLSQMPLKDRLWWATSLLINPRGIGWAHEALHIPPRPSSTPRKFILSQLMWMSLYILQYDITNIFIHRNPCFVTGGPSLTSFGWLWRTTSWLHVSLAYCVLSLSYSMCSIVSVAIGVTEPRDWPHIFGSPLDAYTLRNCWGRVWHQALRKLATGHVDFITKQLRLQKGSFRTILKLFMAFFVTGFIHYAAEYVLYPEWAGHSMEFFLLQPVAITFERTIITLATKAGFSPKPTRFVKFIGFVWVFAWFTYCLPLWLDKVIHSGAMDNGLNYSLVLRLWHGEWRPLR